MQAVLRIVTLLLYTIHFSRPLSHDRKGHRENFAMVLPATKGHENNRECSVAEHGLGGIAGPPPEDDENQQCRGLLISRPSSSDRKGHRKNFAMVLPATEGHGNLHAMMKRN